MAAKSENKNVSNNSSSSNITESETKRKRGRPKGNGGASGSSASAAKAATIKTKIINGKLMKRAVGVPRKVLTGKRGRPRKEYVWVEVTTT